MNDRGVFADALWLGTFQQISNRAAHELKGVLNGVAVNLEVVRSRGKNPGVPAAAINSFADAAFEQLDSVIAISEALLGLARPERQPVDLSRVVRRIHTLLAPAAKADGKTLDIQGAFEDLGATSAGGNLVRLAIGGCLLAATEASAQVRCEPVVGGEPGYEPAIRIECCDGATVSPDGEIVAATVRSGIRIEAEPSAILISFPR